jgi:uncharacterized membrane protein YadS
MLPGTTAAPPRRSALAPLWKTEDYWAIWLGLGIIIFGQAMYATGRAGALASFAVAPPVDWTSLAPVLQHLAESWHRYAVLFLVLLAVFTLSVRMIGLEAGRYIAGFTVIYGLSVAIQLLSSSKFAHYYNLEAPLLALIVGLIAGNLWRVPAWLDTALRTEYYIKTGIVLLGAALPLTLIASAGPIAFLQATIVSICTWFTIYAATTRVFKKEPQLGAVLGAAGAVCGVSAAIAVGASVKARKEQIAIAISVVTIWAIVMIFFIPLASRALKLPTAVAGAWIGTSEFADAAGLAAAQAYSPPMPEPLAAAVQRVSNGAASAEDRVLVDRERPLYENENAIRAFTLMKVIGRDIWIGIWCFILSIVAVTVWERRAGGGSGNRVGGSVIWERFPKFVLGFVSASISMTLMVEAYGAESDEAFSAISRDLINPIKTLRTWTFVFAFLCIGLTTRFRELASFGWQPFWAFTIGVAINVPLGFLLSNILFRDFWLQIR